jgi:hypothetical protein
MTEMSALSGPVPPEAAAARPDTRQARRRPLKTRRRLTRRTTLLLTAVLGIGVLPAFVGGSFAAWTASTSNPGNGFSSNTVLLQDDQGAQSGSATSSGTAIFNVSNLEPNSPATTGCIGVVFTGTAAASTLTLSAALGGSGQSVLQSQLAMTAATYNTSGTVSVTGGSNTNNGSCSNYPAGGTTHTIGSQGATLQAWAAGGPYAIASPVTNTWYQFSISGLPPADNSCVTYCAQTITLSITWTLTAA